MFIQTVSGFLGTTRHFFLYRLNLQKKFTKDLSKQRLTAMRSFSSSNEILIKEFWDHFDIDLKEALGLDNVDDSRYNEKVFSLLKMYQSNPDSSSLDELQEKIEDLSHKFDEPNIFRETPNLIKKLIAPTEDTAKTYMNKHLTDETSLRTIDLFGVYTLEAIIIYVLGVAFNSINETSIVRLSTLLALLQRTVITQAHILKKMEGSTATICSEVDSKEGVTKKNIGSQYEIGRKLVDFMMDRKVIYIELIFADENKPVIIKKDLAYTERNLFVVCNFDLSLLPLKFNLPMVRKPVDWFLPIDNRDASRLGKALLSELQGGYLCGPTLSMYHQGSGLLSSKNLSNFNIQLHDLNYKNMCSILNGLQKQGFQINKKLLEFIKKNRPTLEKEGLLMPGILSRVNLKEAFDFLRIYYYQNKAIQGAFSLDFLLKELAIRVQKARFEELVFKLASAYDNYVFYLPAFMDFRGRIYRSGLFHFHERDLARSLIVFANNHEVDECNQSAMMDIVATSAAFKYQKFDLYDEALLWYKDSQSLIYANNDDSFINFAKGASDPFQFMAKALCNDGGFEYNRIPITQDATASAYQIMSYLLLNEEMAKRTNLIPHPSGKIQDVYTHILRDFKEFLNSRFNDKFKREIIESKLNRKLIKSLFMPLIYGKTVNAMELDIKQAYGQLLSREDSRKIASLSNEFFKETYPDITNLMKLITIIGWFCSALDRPVLYSIPYFTTKQDYKAFDKENISVYEKSSKKRRRVTLSIATDRRDWRKTKTSTCANFIHQKDAYIALKVVESLLSHRAAIYTVHDNFLTTPPFVNLVPDIYTKVFIDMGNPLRIIESYIKKNIIYPYADIHTFLLIPQNKPIPSDYLSDLLKSLTPTKNKQTWSQNVKAFIECYNNYVETVCGNQVSDSNKEPSIDVKWNKFKQLIENRSHNYSVHY